ncbi:inositol monophosphatase family protein [Frigoribacterium sp. 2-23]|uniref:inositol monophosphatase family protein n=1 Tax=Frigoribacterium sp. 2-23 TaxID=3415006 RepID=UPI003C6F3EA3
MPTTAELLEIATTVAREAGELALRRRGEGVRIAATKSSLVDVVTETDREVEEFIRARLAELAPGDGFFGEEGAPDESTTGRTWVVDPIDGTVNFVYGIPAWAVSVAVVDGGADPLIWRALAACVVNPSSGEVFTASLGGGAYLDGERLAVSRPDSLAETLVGTGFSYDAERRVAQAAAVQGIIGEVRDIRRIGAAALDLCSVAAGRLDAYVERGLKPWDHAAGVLIAEEAGARARGEGGRRPSASLTVVSAPAIADELDALLDRAAV